MCGAFLFGGMLITLYSAISLESASMNAKNALPHFLICFAKLLAQAHHHFGGVKQVEFNAVALVKGFLKA